MSEPRARVRIVDRDPEFAGAIAAILRDQRFATRLGLEDGTACDLLVVGLPAPSEIPPGLEPHAPVVLLRSARSGYGVVEEWTLGRPGFAMLEKPVSPTALLRVVQMLLAENEPARPAPKEPSET